MKKGFSLIDNCFKFLLAFSRAVLIMKKGFSLIELVFVVSILGILTVMIVPNYQNMKRKSKQRAIQPHLIHIYGLLRQNYRQKGHYGGFILPEINFTQYYCGIQILTSEDCAPTSPASGYIEIDAPQCAQSNMDKKKKAQQAIKSGFMIIAFSQKEGMDIALNYKKKFFEEDVFDKSVAYSGDFKKAMDELSSATCDTYQTRGECRRAGCRWMGTQCIAPPGC